MSSARGVMGADAIAGASDGWVGVSSTTPMESNSGGGADPGRPRTRLAPRGPIPILGAVLFAMRSGVTQEVERVDCSSRDSPNLGIACLTRR